MYYFIIVHKVTEHKLRQYSVNRDNGFCLRL